MANQVFKMYLVVGTGSCNHGRVFLRDYLPSFESDSCSHLIGVRLLKELDCEIDVPEFDLREIEINAIESSVKKEQEDSQARVNLLLERISKLKAISHDG